jgi:hypothetical protein
MPTRASKGHHATSNRTTSRLSVRLQPPKSTSEGRISNRNLIRLENTAKFFESVTSVFLTATDAPCFKARLAPHRASRPRDARNAPRTLVADRCGRRARPASRASTVITDWQHLPQSARQDHCACSGAFIHYAQFRHLSVRIGGFAGVARGVGVAFVRRKGNSYFLVHNVRRQGKVRQLHLARLGERPKITDDVVRRVSRNHPFLQLDWPSLREQVNNRVPVFDVRSPYVQTLMHALRNLNLDLADLTPPMLVLAGRANSSRELVTQLRLLRSTLEIKLNQFERNDLAVANGGRKFR